MRHATINHPRREGPVPVWIDAVLSDLQAVAERHALPSLCQDLKRLRERHCEHPSDYDAAA